MSGEESSGIQEVDLVFLCDCTGSMGSYISEAQRSIKSIITTLQASEKADLNFALICYRDHPPQDMTYVTKVFPFTASVKDAQSYVDTMTADGGGDGPECIACAMQDILKMDFRKDSLKVVVMISDAPPHGMSDKTGDGFPGGCPAWNDPMKIARKLLKRGIICYTVGVEPSVCTAGTREWLMAIAKITGGRYVPLTRASSLPSVILYGTTEELDLKKYEKAITEEAENVKKELGTGATEEQIDDLVGKRLAEKGIEIRELDIEGFKEDEKLSEIVDKLAKMTSMSQVYYHFSGGSAFTKTLSLIGSSVSGLFSSVSRRSESKIYHDDESTKTAYPYDYFPSPALKESKTETAALSLPAEAPGSYRMEITEEFRMESAVASFPSSTDYSYHQKAKAISSSHVSKVRSKHK